VCKCLTHEGNCESKGLRSDNKIRSGQEILRSDWYLYTTKNVIKARVIVGKAIRTVIAEHRRLHFLYIHDGSIHA